MHIAQILPKYIGYLNDYNKVLMQKNALLKSSLSKKDKKSQIGLWNEQILVLGQKIINIRSNYLKNLSINAANVYQSLSSKTETIELAYVSSGSLILEKSLHNLAELLESRLDEEIEKGMILVGPQRDDLKISLNHKSARQYASQGQQRSIVLSLKLAQLEIIYGEKSEYPLLLLDDVLSELDQMRREYLMTYIHQSKIQSIVTVTSAEKDIHTHTHSLYEVSQGRIRRKI